MSEATPWLYQALPRMVEDGSKIQDKPMYLNSTTLKSLFQMDRPGYQMNEMRRRRRRLQKVEEATIGIRKHHGNQETPPGRRRKLPRAMKETNQSSPQPPPSIEIQVEDAVAAQLGFSREEFDAFETSFSSSSSINQDTERYRQVFEQFDVDHSGSISPDELRTLLKTLGEDDLDETEINDIIQQADADKNGEIEFNEFMEMMQARKRLLAVVQHMGRTGSMTELKSSSKSNAMTPIELPPLKMSQVQSKKHMKQYNRHFTRPTPNCLRPGATTDITSLRRELAMSEYGLKELDIKVREDVQWVQANVPVTSLKAQIFCHKWGAEKMNALFSRILLNFQAKAFNKWMDYVKFLHAKVKADRYLKCKAGSRITSLMNNWKQRSLAKAWVVWSAESIEQARNERHSAAIEIQRIIRGFLSRTVAWRRLQNNGAVEFQRIVRGFLGRRHVARIRRFNLEQASATLLQRCFRGYAGRRLGKLLFRTHEEMRSACKIQRAFRGYQQKLFARAVAQTTRQHEAATLIQCAGRRMLAVREAQRRRSARKREEATRLIQRVGRGMLGRRRCVSRRQQRAAAIKIQSQFKGTQGRRRAKRVRDDKAVKRMHVRRDRAALRIQSAWRGKTGRYSYHLKLRARKEREHQMQILRHKSAIRIQSLYRGHKCRRYCAHLNADRALQRRLEQQNRAVLKIQALWRGFHGRLGVHLKKQAKKVIEREEKEAAIKIQAIARGQHGRKLAGKRQQQLRREFLLQKEREEAATKIQSAIRGKLGRKRAAAKKALYQTSAQEALAKLVKHAKEEAAIRIQCCARGYLSRERYRRRLREHKAKLARLEVERREANAIIRIQCALRKRRATKILAQRRAEFQKRIAAMASERASEEIARLRREQEEELAAMKMKLLLEKEAIEREANRLRDEVEARNTTEAIHLAEEQKKIAHEKLTAILQASQTDKALDRLRAEEQRARENDIERIRLASAEKKQRREAEEVERQQKENAALSLKHSMSALESIKAKEIVRQQEDALAQEKEKTIAQRKILKENHAAIKLQGWMRKEMTRYKIKRIKKEQEIELNTLKNEKERAILKSKHEKEQAKLQIKMLLDEEQRAQEQETRELQFLLKEKELREKQRVEEKKQKNIAAKKIQTAGKTYVARRTLKEQKRQLEFERKKREKAAAAVYDVPVEDEWVEYWDENAQASYYFNIRTQEASWTKPGNRNRDDVTASLLSYSTALTTQDYAQTNYNGYYDQSAYKDENGFYDEGGQYHYYDETKGEGWVQYTDEASGAPYYYNHLTGERYWA